MDNKLFSKVFRDWLLIFIGWQCAFRNKSHVAKVLGCRTSKVFEWLNLSANVSLYDFIRIVIWIEAYSSYSFSQIFGELLRMYLSIENSVSRSRIYTKIDYIPGIKK
jgi:hypothetical protein